MTEQTAARMYYTTTGGLRSRYIIDLSRAFPAMDKEIVSTVTGQKLPQLTHAYHLFRPEFVQSYKTPLCNDVYSNFLHPEERDKWAKATEEAKDYLEGPLIDGFVPTFIHYCDVCSVLNFTLIFA